MKMPGTKLCGPGYNLGNKVEEPRLTPRKRLGETEMKRSLSQRLRLGAKGSDSQKDGSTARGHAV